MIATNFEWISFWCSWKSFCREISTITLELIRTRTHPLELVKLNEHDCLVRTQMAPECFPHIRNERHHNGE